jgi:hypothetical protein
MNRRILVLGPLLLAACGSSAQQHSARLLNERLQMQLSQQIAAGRAVVQRLPDGSRVTLLDASSFSNGEQAFEDQSHDIRADVIEAMLDPSLMRVQLADTSTLPPAQRDVRVQNVEQYFAAYGLGSVLVPAGSAASAAGPAGLGITFSVECPRPKSRAGYGDGKSHPRCE